MPSDTSPSLTLTDEIKALVNDALAAGSSLLLAAVSADGKPVLSFRGSAQVYSDDQIGLWARNGQGGTLAPSAVIRTWCWFIARRRRRCCSSTDGPGSPITSRNARECTTAPRTVSGRPTPSARAWR